MVSSRLRQSDGALVTAAELKSAPAASRKDCGTAQAGDCAQTDGQRSADAVSQSAPEESAERGHAHEHHGIDGHDATAQVIRHHGLDEGVGGRHLQHHAKSDRQEERGRQPEIAREGEQYQAQGKATAGKRHPAAQTFHPGTGREGSKYGIEDYLEIKYLALGGIGT